MKRTCPECKGKGYQVLSYKICENCHGTGVKSQLNVKDHVKGISSQARERFELDEDQEVPCSTCNGKGEIEVRKTCTECSGEGEINQCRKCGKPIKSGDYCPDCQEEKPVVYILPGNAEVEDVELGGNYKGTISRVENYGVFVSLAKNLYGLLRTNSSTKGKGDEIIVKVTGAKQRRGELEITSSKVKDNYELVKVKRNIARTRIGDITTKSMGKTVRLVGEIIQIQQTSGPTIFTVSDETGTTWAAAFDQPGIRVYPHLNMGNIVEVTGEVSLHSGKIQIESESIERLHGPESQEARQRIDEAIDKKAEPEGTEFLIESRV